jgi:Zn2+/Cd2+-exporting ATPase
VEECRLPAEGMDCPSCASTATRGLLELDGVESVEADIIGQHVRVAFDRKRVQPERLRTRLDQLGYPAPAPALPTPEMDRNRVEGRPGGVSEFLRGLPLHVVLGGFFWILTIVATLLGDSEAMVGLLAAVTVVASGWSVFPRAIAAARQGHLDMHVLMAVAATGALAIGEYVEAGAVLFLFAVARTLEQRTLARARSEVESLMDLAPVEATVLRHGHRVRVPVEAVREGETVLVRPGERIPVDGTVLGGSSEVDASAITGESMPEPKFPSDHVFGGSVNGSGALEIRCDQRADDSALSRILRSIEEARSRKSPTEAFIDRFARIYTPVVMAGALAVAVLPPLLGVGPWAEWGYRALVLVVIACPCALVISTPVTVVSALTGAARRGVLVKNGVHLETLGRTRVVALDKTGTLTEGRPVVAGIVSWDGTPESEILAMAATAESRSEHPIARAILAEAGEAHAHLATGIEMTAMPGRGARATISGRNVLIGSPRLFREEGVLGERESERADEMLEHDGGTIVLVGWNDAEGEAVRIRGTLVIRDRPREGIEQLLQELRNVGMRHVVLMSGDRNPAVQAAASGPDGSWHFDEWRGDLLPEEKVEWIRELRDRHGPVLMVGDGVNDAPALAAADVGMAMAREGTALAVDTADIALMEDDLSRIPLTFRLGRKAAGIIRANIVFALAVKVVFVALGGMGLATLWMAVLADMGSSLAVILNGLRTLKV